MVKMTQQQQANINDFFTPFFRKNTEFRIIYVGALMRKASLNEREAFQILEHLCDTNMLKRVYQFRCPDDSFRQILRTNYASLPQTIICPESHEEYNVRDNLFIVYEVNQ